MKIIIFGSTGMLGNYVWKYLSQFHEDVICIDRKVYDIQTCDWRKLDEILSVFSSEDVIINCAGAIPQQKCDFRKFIAVNTIFPHRVNDISKKYGIKFIHITTDCVFSGKEGNYNELSKHDAEDIYGISKSLGECDSCCIIRTSIIGEELHNKNSLLEWVLGHKSGGSINGYSQVLWNGITCLQLSIIIEKIITSGRYWVGVRHFHSPTTVSKFELCQYINEVYELDLKVIKLEDFSKKMTLSSNYLTKFIIPEIKEQIKTQRVFNLQ
jgi:dTDP-4-dehydrorhamnose reductase